MRKTLTALLINPWITDFAAYNLWAEPLGLFYIGSVLKRAGAEISYIDCLTSSEEGNPRPKKNGCSKYRRTVVQKPPPLDFMNRDFACYGMGEEEFIRCLSDIPTPQVVLVTSMMTYWYPGVLSAIRLVKNHFGRAIPVILGGIYTKLCSEHARRGSGADYIFTGENMSSLLELIEGLTGRTLEKGDAPAVFSDHPQPLHELGPKKHFFSVLTGKGCPFGCTYCASHIINPFPSQRSVRSVIEEILLYRKMLSTPNVVFYDDALLVNSENYLIPILREIVTLGLNLSIHLPNGIHARFVTADLVKLFREAGVATIRIGLETADESLQKMTGNKTGNNEYRNAVELLRSVGYTREEVGTYAMLGMPNQAAADVRETIQFIYKCGGAPLISYFSPIPGTGIWCEAVRTSPYPIEAEPLFHNNTVFIEGNRAFGHQTVAELKELAIELRNLP
jgi:radical SAM superfamily enzyme YgiQ (UPF0313 family)